MSAPKVIVENLGKQFPRRSGAAPRTWRSLLRRTTQPTGPKTFWGLRNVSFTVKGGEMLGVIGANGAGKSTLLRLLGGIGRATCGQITIDGRIGALLDLGGGFQRDLTGRENAILAGVVAGLLRREVETLLPQIVAFAELEECIDELLHTYSSGMAMRLAFAVAVHTRPEVLLVDEFLSVGDLSFQARCQERIAALRREGCAIVLVSHSMEQVREVCDRTLWLRRGEPAAFDATDIVTRVYETEVRNATLARTPRAPMVLSSSGVELVTHENRMGTLEVEITQVTLLPGPKIQSGEALAVRVRLLAHHRVAAPIVTVSITRGRDGFVCLDTNTQKALIPLAAIEGTFELTLTLDRLELMAGTYFVNVGIYEASWAHAYDYHWEAYPLHVEGAAAHAGLLAPPSRWQIEPRA